MMTGRVEILRGMRYRWACDCGATGQPVHARKLAEDGLSFHWLEACRERETVPPSIDLDYTAITPPYEPETE